MPGPTNPRLRPRLPAPDPPRHNDVPAQSLRRKLNESTPTRRRRRTGKRARTDRRAPQLPSVTLPAKNRATLQIQLIAIGGAIAACSWEPEPAQQQRPRAHPCLRGLRIFCRCPGTAGLHRQLRGGGKPAGTIGPQALHVRLCAAGRRATAAYPAPCLYESFPAPIAVEVNGHQVVFRPAQILQQHVTGSAEIPL
jgi:hypothetical protein